MRKTTRFRCALIIFAVAITAASLITAGLFAPRVSAQSPLSSVIVELRGDPVVVAKARAQAAGQSFNADSYRQQVIAEQQQFLQRLTLAGVPYRISSVNAPNGPITPTIPPRGSENDKSSNNTFSPYAFCKPLAITTSLPSRGAGGITISFAAILSFCFSLTSSSYC